MHWKAYTGLTFRFSNVMHWFVVLELISSLVSDVWCGGSSQRFRSVYKCFQHRMNYQKSLLIVLPVVLILANFLRGWTVSLPQSSSKTFSTIAMAQADETIVPLIVVYITVPNKEAAAKLASSLVNSKLAACVNQVPGVLSTYMWEGKMETDEGILLIVKTRQSLLDALTVHVKENHPYTVPEVIALPILGGSDSYVKWVAENTRA